MEVARYRSIRRVLSIDGNGLQRGRGVKGFGGGLLFLHRLLHLERLMVPENHTLDLRLHLVDLPLVDRQIGDPLPFLDA